MKAVLYFLFWFLLPFRITPPGTAITPETPIAFQGVTMGTTYHITYFDSEKRNFKDSVDSLLAVVNKCISTYDSASEISRFNRSKNGIDFRLPYLKNALKKAKEVHAASGGAFDPTVMPLVNAWGFGPEAPVGLSPHMVDSLRELIGFANVVLTEKGARKKDPRIQLDLGGIGQGFGADVVFQFLRSKGIRNLLVELGGEGLSAGKNLQKDKPWIIGILDPNSTLEGQFFKAYVTLGERAFTTSGNYFNYRVIDGRKYGHTIDPVTGYPVQSSLLSASVFASDCSTADAWATACMVMGVDKAMHELTTQPELDAILFYSGEDGKIQTYITPRIRERVVLEP